MSRFILDFTRSSRGDESSVQLPDGDTEYQLRGRGQSRPDLAEIRWSPVLLERLEALRDHSEVGVSEEAARIGRTLADFIDVPGWAEASRQIVERGDRDALSLSIRSNAAEVYLLPWELLSVGAITHVGFLSKLLVRYEWPDTRATPRLPGLSQTARGRVIFAWSAAGGKVDAARHVKLIERSLDSAAGLFDEADGRALDVVENASVESIRACLDRAKAAGEPVAILHVLCHGGTGDDGVFGLVLNGVDDPSAAELVNPSRLQQSLMRFAGLVRLVVVSACDGGNAGPIGHELGSVAQTLHKAGFPAVIASRFPLSWDGARVFAASLYDHLLRELSSLEDAFLAARSALSRRAAFDWASLQLYAREADGDATFIFNARPYRGLAAFAPEQSRFFFGRDHEVTEVVRDLDALVAASKPRFIVVSGASGTGKSSLVLGGAIPRWTRAAGDAGFAFVVVRPGGAPDEALKKIEARRAAMAPGARLLVVVDQFEELFTHVETLEATAFARALWAMATRADSGVSVVATLRIDFLGRCAELSLDDDGLRFDKIACDPSHQVLVAQMSPEQLREAIERPARSAGIALEANLAELVVRDVAAEPGALPLMSHALYLLWLGRSGSTLTRAAYEALGSVHGALDTHAEEQLAALDSADRAAVRRLMVRLVHAGTNGAADTRRRRNVDALRPTRDDDRARFDRVLARLVDARLLVTGEGAGGAQTVEIAHEALIRSWRSFKAWIDAERTRLARLDQLEEWVRDWVKSPDQLLRGSKLGYAEEIAAEHKDDLGVDARRLVEESVAARSRELHEAERARRVRRAVIGSAIAGLSIFAAVLGALGLYARRQAKVAVAQEQKALRNEREARVARTRAELDEVVSAAATLRTRAETPGHELRNLADALTLYGTSAARGIRRAEVDGALFQTALAALSRRQLAGHEGRVETAEFSPDGARVVTASIDGTARLWDARSGAEVAVLRGHRGGLRAATFSEDGSRIVTASEDNTARLWDAREGGRMAVLEGHTEPVSDARFSPDGTCVVTASDDHTARLWDARTGLAQGEGAVLQGHDDAVSLALFSPDGARVLTASGDGTAAVWSARDGRRLCVCRGHDKSVVDARFSPDGRLIATASADNTAALWDARTCRRTKVLRGHEGALSHIAFSQQGTRVATTSEDGTAAVWDVERGERIALCRGHIGTVNDVAFSRDGASIYTTSVDLTVRMWNAETGAPLGVWLGHTNVVQTVVLNPSSEGARFVTASADRTARLWNVRAGDLSIPLAGHADWVNDARFSPDGTRVVTASDDHTARLWNAETGALLVAMSDHTEVVNTAAFSPDGSLLVTASRDRTARVRDARDGAVRAVLTGHTDSVSFATFSHRGALVLTASKDSTARLWDAATGAPVGAPMPHDARVFRATFSSDDALVATASEDNTAGVWNARTGALIARLRGHTEQVNTVDFSPDGLRVVTSSEDRTAKVWDTRTGQLLMTLSGHGDDVSDARFSPDGSLVLTTSHDATARLWSARDGRYLRALLGHGAPLYSGRFSRDGGRVVTTSLDNTARVWDVLSGVCLSTLAGHTQEPMLAYFSPDGRRVVTASGDRTARVWNLDPAGSHRAACDLLRGTSLWDRVRPFCEGPAGTATTNAR